MRKAPKDRSRPTKRRKPVPLFTWLNGWSSVTFIILHVNQTLMSSMNFRNRQHGFCQGFVSFSLFSWPGDF